MKPVIQMALKDLKLLFRDKMGAFFIVVFPILMGLFFGLMMGGFSEGGRAAMKIALVDQDQSDISKKFVESLRQNESIELIEAELEPAKERVRKGSLVGLMVVPEGFGRTAGMFWEDPPTVQIGMDPSRSAEAGMMQGFVMEAIGSLAGERFQNPDQMRASINDAREQVRNAEDINVVNQQLLLGFFGTVDSLFESMEDIQERAENDDEVNSPMQGGFQFANIESLDISRKVEPGSREAQIKKLNSRWDISFPQAMMWGIMGCVSGFSISLVREKSLGTMTRLQVAPVSLTQILASKALACFLTVCIVISMMTLLGVLLPGGLKPNSYPLLVLAGFSTAFCFVGIMMTFSVMGKTEQSVSGVGWAINMIMAMLGGCMIPVMFMPKMIAQFSFLSPLRWSILSIEGAIWRQFTLAEMLMPCLILVGIGVVGLSLGVVILKKRV